jgi:hypothetical protein
VSGWSLVQKSPTECGVSECDLDTSKKGGGLGLIWAVAPQERKGSDKELVHHKTNYRLLNLTG